MREILFRGRPVSGGEYYFFSQIWKDNCKDDFVYGSLVVDGDRYYICVSAMRSINVCINNGTTSMIEVMPETVGQFTGLLDKNNNKIFEGDILEYRSYTGRGLEEVNRAIVFWDEHRWSYKRIYSNRWTVSWNNKGYECDIYKNVVEKYGEVVGNIYNNPELIV